MKLINRTVVLLTLIFFTANLIAQTEELTFTVKYEVPASPVRNQSNSGTCWAFAGISFLESELIRMGKGEIDLSEMYIVREAYSAKVDNYVRLHGKANLSSGGQAHDVLNMITNYGAITEDAYSGLLKGNKTHNHSELDKKIAEEANTLLAEKANKEI